MRNDHERLSAWHVLSTTVEWFQKSREIRCSVLHPVRFTVHMFFNVFLCFGRITPHRTLVVTLVSRVFENHSVKQIFY